MDNQSPQIIPMSSYEDGIAAMDWLCNVFGFSERARMVDDNEIRTHGEITLGAASLRQHLQHLITRAKTSSAGLRRSCQIYSVPYT